MAKLANDYMPYAFVGNVVDVIRRLREAGLPNPLTSTEVTRVGVSEGNASRTIAALQFLGLVNEKGEHTESIGAIERAKTDEYPELLAEILRNAYSRIFQIVNPEIATEIDIIDAFRGFSPSKQRKRMANLFIGLCQEANIREGEPVTRDAPRDIFRQDGQKQPKRKNDRRMENFVSPKKGWFREAEYLLGKLPEFNENRRPKWTEKERENWINFLNVWLDMNIDVVEDEGGD